MSGFALDYPGMAFELADGSVLSVASGDLSMCFTAENFLVDHSDGRLEIPIADLSKFYFVSDYSAVVSPESEADRKVEVFSGTGLRLGVYDSEAAAKAVLPRGLYVMKSVSRTFKTIVK